MAEEQLESRIIIHDEVSKILKNIAKQSEIASESLAMVNHAANEIKAMDNITIHAAVDVKKKSLENLNLALNEQKMMGLPVTIAPSAPKKDVFTTATSAPKKKAFSIKEIEKELREPDSIDLSELERFNEQCERSWGRVLGEIEADADEILKEWNDAERGIYRIYEEVEQGAEEEAKEQNGKVRRSIIGLGANIAGWFQIAKDVIGQLVDVFNKLAEESDKLNTRKARFGLVADAEGKTGEAREKRSEELYKEQQKYAQALGVRSEAFNETVMNMYSNGEGVVKSIEEAQAIAASSYMAMDIAGLSGRDKDAVMGEVQSMVNVGIADPDQIQESMKIAPNILRTIERQWQKNMNGKALKLSSGEEISDATGKIAMLAQEGQITAELVAQAMVNSAEETNRTWQKLPSTWEKLKNRVSVIVENMTYEILKKIGEIADDPQVADFVMSALNLGKQIVAFVKGYVLPIIGGVLKAIGSALTTVFNILGEWYTAIAVLPVMALGLTKIVIAAGLIPKILAAIRVAMLALAANPIMAIVGALLLASFAMAHLVRTTQTGQEIMLEVTAAISMAFQQVGAAICNLPGIIYSAFRGVQSFMNEFVTGILKLVALALEKLSSVSETAQEAALSLRNTIAERETEHARFEKESEKIKEGWMSDFDANYNVYQNYRKEIPEIAAENLAKNKDELKLTGFLDNILKGQAKAPGQKNNPAHVKGKVAIDGEYFDIIKRAAGVEIVNRYTTLRPTVNAKFGDIHQIDAEDVIGKLGAQVQAAENAAISDAQAMGA